MNTALLKSCMVLHKDTQSSLAAALGISRTNLNDKINGSIGFRQAEIAAIKRRYNLTAEDVDAIFFAA